MSADRDGEAGRPVVEQGDVAAQGPAGAAVGGALRLTQVGVARHRLQLDSLDRTHGDDGLVAEERGPVCGLVDHMGKLRHWNWKIISTDLSLGDQLEQCGSVWCL